MENMPWTQVRFLGDRRSRAQALTEQQLDNLYKCMASGRGGTENHSLTLGLPASGSTIVLRAPISHRQCCHLAASYYICMENHK